MIAHSTLNTSQAKGSVWMQILMPLAVGVAVEARHGLALDCCISRHIVFFGDTKNSGFGFSPLLPFSLEYIWPSVLLLAHRLQKLH